MDRPISPAGQPGGSRKTSLIVLALVLLLLLAGGVYVALDLIRPKSPSPAADGVRSTARSNDSNPKPVVAQQAAPRAGAALGGALGAGAKDAPASGKALDSPSQAGRQSEQHDSSNGTTSGAPNAAPTSRAASAMAGFLGALSNAVGGVHRHDPVDFHALEALLPSSLPGMPDATPGGGADETMSIKTTSAHVDFGGPSDARIHLSIRDATAISGLAGLADMANADSSEQGDSYEKTETIDGRTVHEKWDATARHGELSMSVGQRFAVDVVGDSVDMAALKNALARIDLAKLESMKDANPVTK